MSLCSSCLQAEELPKCLTHLVIGTISPTTAYYIYLKDTATDVTLRFSATSDGAGLLTADISSTEWMPGHIYELWVTTQAATNTQTRQTITIGASTGTCVDVRFYEVDDQTYTSQTIVLEA